MHPVLIPDATVEFNIEIFHVMWFCVGSTEAAAELRKELQSLRSRVESLEQELKTKDEEMKRVCKQQSLPADQVSLQGRSQDERCKVNLHLGYNICSQHDYE